MAYPNPTQQQCEFFNRHGWLVVEDAIAQHDLDQIESHCERIITEKETLANDWAWAENESKAERSFRIVQGSPSKVWPEIADQAYRLWLVDFGSTLMKLRTELKPPMI